MLSFTFDDAPQSAVLAGARILQAHGLRGTYYVAAGLAGRKGPVGRYASAEEMLAAEAAGHELACHTFSHLDCGQASGARISADVDQNVAALNAWGARPATNFAYPYGDVCLAAKRALGGRFDLLRALHPGLIETGCDLNQAPAVGIEGEDGRAFAERWLERAARRKAWLILYTHDVDGRPSPWGSTPATLEALILAARRLEFDIVTVAEGAARLR